MYHNSGRNYRLLCAYLVPALKSNANEVNEFRIALYMNILRKLFTIGSRSVSFKGWIYFTTGNSFTTYIWAEWRHFSNHCYYHVEAQISHCWFAGTKTTIWSRKSDKNSHESRTIFSAKRSSKSEHLVVKWTFGIIWVSIPNNRLNSPLESLQRSSCFLKRILC